MFGCFVRRYLVYYLSMCYETASYIVPWVTHHHYYVGGYVGRSHQQETHGYEGCHDPLEGIDRLIPLLVVTVIVFVKLHIAVTEMIE